MQGVLAMAASAGEPRRSGSGRSQVARQVAGQMSRVENQYDSMNRREKKAKRAVAGRAAAAAGPSHVTTAEAGSSHGRARQHTVRTKVHAGKRN